MSAKDITTEQAESIARQFLSKNSQTKKNTGMKMVRRQPLPLTGIYEAPAYYAFNVGSNDGYIVVSGSDLFPKVLAYSTQGSFNQEEVPSNMKAWLEGYADQIAYLERTEGRNQAPRLLAQHNAVTPLLSSRWGQGAPYNNDCPTHPSANKKCLTGCVATALAQVLNYYKYPSKTVASIPAYKTYTNEINMPAITTTSIDWVNMLDSYNGSATTTQKNAVSKLMLLCGQAVEMDYGISAIEGGSGANMALDAKALQKYFGYDKSVRSLERNAFSTTTWESLIYDELAAGRPVLYGGYSACGGHAFVVDGYNNNGLFHINWGWEGSYDGYFLLSVLNPYDNSTNSYSDDSFSFMQHAIIGIQHNTDEVVPERFTVTSIKSTGENTYTRTSTSVNFTGISIRPTIENITGDTHSFKLALALYDFSDKWLTKLPFIYNGNQYNAVNYGELGHGFYEDEDEEEGFEFSDISFGADMEDGDYYIVPVSASENSEIWEPCWGANVYRIKVTINGKKLTLSEPLQKLNGVFNPSEYTTGVGKTVHLSAIVTNSGSYYNNDIYLVDESWNVKAGFVFEVEEGASSTVGFDYVPTTPGSQKMFVAYVDGNYWVRFASVTLDVAEDNAQLAYKVVVTNIENGCLAENMAKVKVTVTNKNSTAYNDNVRIGIYKLKESDGYYYLSDDFKMQHLSLSSGRTTTLNFEFDNLEDEQKYLLSFEYLRAGTWIDEYGYAIFNTKFEEPDPTNSLYVEPEELLVVKKQFELPIRLKNNVNVAGMSFTLTLPKGMTLAEDEDGDLIYHLNSERAKSGKFTAYWASREDSSYGICLMPTGTSTISGTDGIVMTLTVNVDEWLESDDYPILLTSNSLTVKNSDGSLSTLKLNDTSSTLSIITVLQGDVNNDSRVDLTDAVMIVYASLGVEQVNFLRSVADMNHDDCVDLTDAVMVIYQSLGANEQSMQMNGTMSKASAVSENELIVEEVVIASGGIVDLPVKFANHSGAKIVGMQMNLILPEGISTVKDEEDLPVYILDGESCPKMNLFTAPNDGFALVPQTEKACIKGTEGTLFTTTLRADEGLEDGICLEVKVTNAIFTVKDENGSHSVPIEDFSFNITLEEKTTAISNVADDSGNSVVRYNIAGQRVGDYFKGIIVTNGKKIVVK